MKLSKEERENTLNDYIRLISHFQDKDYQTRIWIRGEGPECQGFDDAVCDFFDIGDPILEDYKDFEITEDQYKQLKKLRKKFQAFVDENDLPQEFIDTFDWEKIMEMAKNVLKAFNYPIRGRCNERIKGKDQEGYHNNHFRGQI
jgi:hypothetical protein